MFPLNKQLSGITVPELLKLISTAISINNYVNIMYRYV